MIVCQTKDYHFPPLPLKVWEETKETLHLYLQIVGKIRLRNHPKLNHWWHVTLYPFSQGLSTGKIPYCGRSFEIEFNFTELTLQINTSDGKSESFPFAGLTVAEFYSKTFNSLSTLGIETSIYPYPYLVNSKMPFSIDTTHRTDDTEYLRQFWIIVNQAASIFEEFRGRFSGKATPVQVFWHSMDLAYTRFSGRLAPPRIGGTKVDREAYSHEVISFGFWPGDDTLPEPAFYSYTYPAPENLSNKPLKSDKAQWGSLNGNTMALLKYEDMRTSTNPKDTLLEFMESAYQAGAQLAKWPIDDLRRLDL